MRGPGWRRSEDSMKGMQWESERQGPGQGEIRDDPRGSSRRESLMGAFQGAARCPEMMAGKRSLSIFNGIPNRKAEKRLLRASRRIRGGKDSQGVEDVMNVRGCKPVKERPHDSQEKTQEKNSGRTPTGLAWLAVPAGVEWSQILVKRRHRQ